MAYENRVLEVEELIDQTQKGGSDTEHHEYVLELVEEREMAPSGPRPLQGHLLGMLKVMLGLQRGGSMVCRENLLYSWFVAAIFSVLEGPIFEVLSHFLRPLPSPFTVAYYS